MAETWQTNDSAREMARKYNGVALELNKLASTTLAINEQYVTLTPSEFDIEKSPEVAKDGV